MNREAAAIRVNRPSDRNRVSKIKRRQSSASRKASKSLSLRSELSAADQLRAFRVLSQEIAFIHNGEFTTLEADRVILEELDTAAPSAILPDVVIPDTTAFFAELYRTPLLCGDEEFCLFRRMNYLKFKANRLRLSLDRKAPDFRTITEIERLLELSVKARDRIVTANLRLVVSIARKFETRERSFDELLSDGTFILMRAVEKFDYSRGFRLSTYATHAIQRELYRMSQLRRRDRLRFTQTAEDFGNEAGDVEDLPVMAQEDVARSRHLVSLMQAELSERERYILSMRFGLDDAERPHTLRELGVQLGVSKERIRQIAIRAVDRLKQLVAEQSTEPNS